MAGDGRFYNREAMARIFCVLAGNGVARVLVPRGGIMSTPAVSACVRRLGGGEACSAIVLTASPTPGGPGQDFGIKYNGGLGQPADEKFTETAYARSLELGSYRTVAGRTGCGPGRPRGHRVRGLGDMQGGDHGSF